MQNTRTIALIVWMTLATPLPLPAPHQTRPAADDRPAAAATEPVESPDPHADTTSPSGERAGVEIDGATVHAADRESVADVAWALQRFDVAALDLPHVEVWMHTDRSSCEGHNGYLENQDGVWVVHSCGTRFTLLHELAHVWDNHALTDEQRAEFLAERGLESWSGEWSRAGGEHLANVVAWALHDEHPRPNRTEPIDDASLASAYALATGGGGPLDG